MYIYIYIHSISYSLNQRVIIRYALNKYIQTWEEKNCLSKGFRCRKDKYIYNSMSNYSINMQLPLFIKLISY
jgi:hypothetical protein